MMLNKLSENRKDILLIVFAKNPVLGKVKSRLAKSIGFYNSFLVYKELLYKTHEVIKDIDIPKLVCYSDFVDHNDLWENDIYQKIQQKGDDIGIRMRNAFKEAFNQAYKRIVLIGSDIINLKPGIIYEAFNTLNESDVVFGPAKDGGYYLLGMNTLHEGLFHNISWGSNKVFIQSLNNCLSLDLKTKLVKELSDLDRVEDFQHLSFEDRKRYYDIIGESLYPDFYSSGKNFIKKGA